MARIASDVADAVQGRRHLERRFNPLVRSLPPAAINGHVVRLDGAIRFDPK